MDGEDAERCARLCCWLMSGEGSGRSRDHKGNPGGTVKSSIRVWGGARGREETPTDGGAGETPTGGRGNDCSSGWTLVLFVSFLFKNIYCLIIDVPVFVWCLSLLHYLISVFVFVKQHINTNTWTQKGQTDVFKFLEL